MKVLVCGGRNYDDEGRVMSVLDEVRDRALFMRVIQGGASGADMHARTWCLRRDVPYEHYPADWKAHGKAAGPIRNMQMLREGKPELVVAFSGGKGTADMIDRARRAGIEVMEVA